MKQPLKPDTRFNRFIGYKRLWFGFCPRCNSDAPLVDTCGTCNRAYDKDGRDVKNTRDLYPPTLATKALWLFTWMHPHADAKQDWLESGIGYESKIKNALQIGRKENHDPKHQRERQGCDARRERNRQ